jgi:hypothetical protein
MYVLGFARIVSEAKADVLTHETGNRQLLFQRTPSSRASSSTAMNPAL